MYRYAVGWGQYDGSRLYLWTGKTGGDGYTGLLKELEIQISMDGKGRATYNNKA